MWSYFLPTSGEVQIPGIRSPGKADLCLVVSGKAEKDMKGCPGMMLAYMNAYCELAKEPLPCGGCCCAQREEPIMAWLPHAYTTRTLAAVCLVYLVAPKVAVQVLI